ncbi:MAG: hypothetical protein F4Z18_11110 [Caldilineaceae bacterium SB0666_bin_21]|nr:hypothetical protein [Caldilineaceae bacterium SB0666_bin_21]
MRDPQHRGRRAAAVVACLLLTVLAAWHLELDRFLPARLALWSERPQSRTVVSVGTAEARITIELSDRSHNWSWTWTEPDCLEALAAWARTWNVRRLALDLTDPDRHPSDLPVRSIYPEQHPESAAAGAWCEPQRSGNPSAVLACTVGVLAGRHPLHVTVAIAGALYQGLALVRDPGAFTRPTMQSWNWARLGPVVIPADGPQGWDTACPHLTPDRGQAS